MKIRIKCRGGYMSVSELAQMCGGRIVGGDTQIYNDKTICGVCTDSREAEAGTLFAAIVGERTDGHDYIESAAALGATAVLAEHLPDNADDIDIPIILTDGTVPALSKIAAAVSGDIPAKRVAVTGSVGKTTTKEFIFSVLGQSGEVYRTEGNRNSVIGMPLSMLEIPASAGYAVLEMGMSALGEIESMSLAARPDVAVITNIGSSHLEYLGTRENIARAKLEIRAGLSPDGLLLLNGDEPLLADVGAKDPRAVYFSSSGNSSAGFYISDLRDTGSGCVFNINTPDGVIRDAEISVPGRHNAQAALIAAAVGMHFGLSEADVRRGLREFRPVAMRQNFITVGGLNILNDCYNASPESVRAAIDVLIPAARRSGGIAAAILGDMGELGADSPVMHRAVGRYFAEKGGEFLIAYGPRSAETARGAAEAGLLPENIVRIPDISSPDAPRIAAEAAELTLGSKDILLIKASRSVKAERIIEALRNSENR